nr:hypothetical protein [Tanacetum cinerariifolium]
MPRWGWWKEWGWRVLVHRGGGGGRLLWRLEMVMSWAPAGGGRRVARSGARKGRIGEDSAVDARKKAPEVDESEASDNYGKNDQVLRSEVGSLLQQERQTGNINSTNNFNNVSSPVNTVRSSFVNAASQTPINVAGPSASTNAFEEDSFEQFSPFKNAFSIPHVPIVTPIDYTRIFGNAYDDDVLEKEVDMNNVDSSYTIPEATMFLKDHPQDQAFYHVNVLLKTFNTSLALFTVGLGEMRKVNDFIAMDSKAQESSTKRTAEHLESNISKKQNVDENVELVIDDSEELKKCMEIVPDDGDEVLIEATPLSSRSPTIIDYKIHKEGKKNYFKIIRADDRFKKEKPVDDMDNLLFRTLKTMFKHHVEDTIWKYQQGLAKVKLFESYGVYCITMQSTIYYLLVKKVYPLTRNILHQLWSDVRIQVDHDVEMAYDLLRFIRKKLMEGYTP